MSLDFTKVTYVNGETVITAENLNDIQDAILDLDDNKVEKEQGKGLSTNDYTNADKQKVDDAYVAPEGGIPKTALSQSVQESLEKADEVPDLKSASELFDEYLKGTTQAVNFANGKPSSIVHTKNGSTVRTDSFVWGNNSVTETRTLADGSYITIATNLDTLVTVISDIQGGT